MQQFCTQKSVRYNDARMATVKQKDALSLFWVASSLHKILFDLKSTVANVHEPLEFLCNPNISVD